MTIDARSILCTKRDGGELSEEEIRYFIKEYVDEEIPEHMASALLMAIFINGMQPRELERWTRAMLESGQRLAFPELDRGVVDKHSTGGVGDKVSIPLAPAVAACGLAVPMISGRGLSHTGGTLDKLESIPGFRTDLSEDEIRHGVRELGLAFAGQTEDIVPADRLLYRLRDVTGLIESVPLIASSIMSKKLAEGIGGLVLDVKFGAGAFLPEPERGRELALVMMQLARDMGVTASAYQTSMHEPLGRTVGHALEITECLECLAGEGPDDLRELVTLFGGEMLVLGGASKTLDEGRARIAGSLDDGSAMGVFERVVAAQGGEPDALKRLESAPHVEELCAEASGVLEFVDTRAVGMACCALGGGRARIEDEIDPAVGFVWLRKAGETVERGDVLCEIHHRGHRGHGLEQARAELASAIRIGAPFELPPLVLARVDA